MADAKKTQQTIETLLKEEKGKKNFTQTVDLIISLKEFNPKNPQEKIDEYVTLPHGNFKKISVCALVGKELAPNAKKHCDQVITQEEFNEWAENPRRIKKLVRKHDYFIAQANLMPEIAKTFGKYLGSKGKMPNPKIGLIIPPNGDTSKTIKNLQNLARIKTKNQPNIHTIIGKENMTPQQLTQNAMTIIERVEQLLPRGKQQIKKITVKLTMSKPKQIQ